MRSNRPLCFVSVAMGLSLGILGPAWAAGPLDGETELPTTALTPSVNGIAVSISVIPYVKVVEATAGPQVGARVVVRLGDLQRKFPAIIDGFALPHDNCRSFSANNPVVALPTRELVPADIHAQARIAGSVTLWDCRQNPICKSRIVRDRGPKVRCIGPGDPFKNKLGTQSFDARVRIAVEPAPDRKGVQFVVGDPLVELTGRYATVTRGILRLANIDINAEVKKALDKAIDPAKLLPRLPPAILVYEPTVDAARFREDGGELVLEVRAKAPLGGRQLNMLMRELIRRQHK